MSWKNKQSKEDKKWFDDYFGVTQKKKDKRYSLTFNGNIICKNVNYPVCVSQRNKMIKTGQYNNMKHLFKITPFKTI